MTQPSGAVGSAAFAASMTPSIVCRSAAVVSRKPSTHTPSAEAAEAQIAAASRNAARNTRAKLMVIFPCYQLREHFARIEDLVGIERFLQQAHGRNRFRS